VGCFGRTGNKARGGWVAGGIAGGQPGLGRLLEEVIDAVGVCLSHGLAKPLDVCLKVVESFVVA